MNTDPEDKDTEDPEDPEDIDTEADDDDDALYITDGLILNAAELESLRAGPKR